jgi:hypothetical protein
MTSPKTLEKLIGYKRAKLARLDERIGALMSQRVDEEEKLAELLNKQGRPVDPTNLICNPVIDDTGHAKDH